MDLPIIRLEIEMQATQPVELPDYAGSTFRGAFGTALKNGSCLLEGENRCGKQCRQPDACAYGSLFETPMPDTALERLQASQYAPHPYLIRPLSPGSFLFPGDPIRFELRLLGRVGQRAVPKIAEVARRMGSQGLGKGRNDGQGGTELVALRDFDSGEVVYDAESDEQNMGAIRRLRPNLAPNDTDNNPDIRGVRITADTPLHLLFRGELIEEPDFGEFVYQSVDRLHQIASCFATSPGRALSTLPKPDAVAADARSADVETVETDADLVEFNRFSHRQDKKHPLKGVRGTWTFEGDVGPFLPALRIGELLHIGGKTSFGLGAIDVEVLE